MRCVHNFIFFLRSPSGIEAELEILLAGVSRGRHFKGCPSVPLPPLTGTAAVNDVP